MPIEFNINYTFTKYMYVVHLVFITLIASV